VTTTEQLHLDTHVVIWLAAGEMRRFPPSLLERMESADLVVSPIVRLELDLLHERGKIASPASDLVDKVTVEVGLREDRTPLSRIVMAAITPRKAWHNCDPYDRLILSTALANQSLLVTKDGPLRAAFPDSTVWDEPVGADPHP